MRFNESADKQLPSSKPVDCFTSDFDVLRKKYFELKREHGLDFENTPDCQLYLTNHFIDRSNGIIEADCVFSSPKTIFMLWEIQSLVDFGCRNFLVLGETGVGKESIAKIINKRSISNKVVSVNCANLSQNIAESLLFGIAPNAGIANTDPKAGKIGFVDDSQNGVLFLDEFFDAPTEVMPMLLRLIENRKYTPVGGVEKPFDGYIVAASNKYTTENDLENAIDTGDVRRDLIARFNRPFIVIPPLKERPNEIGYIAEQVLNNMWQQKKAELEKKNRLIKYKVESNFNIKLSGSSKALLSNGEFIFKNNIRDIRNFLELQLRILLESKQLNVGINEYSHEYELDISSKVIAQFFQRQATRTCDITNDTRPHEQLTLPSWNSSHLKKLKEFELIGQLFKEMGNQESVNRNWVADRCRSLLGEKDKASNISEKLNQILGFGCEKIADKLNEMKKRY